MKRDSYSLGAKSGYHTSQGKRQCLRVSRRVMCRVRCLRPSPLIRSRWFDESLNKNSIPTSKAYSDILYHQKYEGTLEEKKWLLRFTKSPFRGWWRGKSVVIEVHQSLRFSAKPWLPWRKFPRNSDVTQRTRRVLPNKRVVSSCSLETSPVSVRFPPENWRGATMGLLTVWWLWSPCKSPWWLLLLDTDFLLKTRFPYGSRDYIRIGKGGERWWTMISKGCVLFILGSVVLTSASKCG